MRSSARHAAQVALWSCLAAVLSGCLSTAAAESTQERQRIRNLGLVIGHYPTGPLNAITDVEGVKVGHTTLFRAWVAEKNYRRKDCIKLASQEKRQIQKMLF